MTPKRSLNSFVSLLLLVALPSSSLLLSGCAHTADAKKTQAQGTGIGALGGAALGYLVGGQNGAAVGALVGGAAGFAYGTNVAKRKAKYAKTEQWLDQEIALAHEANASAYAYNQTLQQRIEALEKKVKAARGVKNTQKLDALKSEISQISEETQSFEMSQKQVEIDVKDVLSDKGAHAAPNFDSFEREATAFAEAAAERGRLSGRLASLRDSIDR